MFVYDEIRFWFRREEVGPSVFLDFCSGLVGKVASASIALHGFGFRLAGYEYTKL